MTQPTNSTQQNKELYNQVYIVSDIFKITCMFFIKGFLCIKINPKVQEKEETSLKYSLTILQYTSQYINMWYVKTTSNLEP